MQTLVEIAETVQACQRCRLGKTRTNAVPGEGPPDAEIMFIGEAPGFHEDRQGRPFVGASGNLLEQLLADIGFSRGQVYIANVVKCRPPGNRDPLPDEQAACGDYLERQIELIRPKVIVTLGRFSMARYFPGQSISRIHGQVKRAGPVAYLPTFHPAAALRQPRWLEAIKQDFAKIPALLEELRAATAKGDSPRPANEGFDQLSLF